LAERQKLGSEISDKVLGAVVFLDNLSEEEEKYRGVGLLLLMLGYDAGSED
jgi:hypothetical protein